MLNLKSSIARVYLPPDANCFLSTISHCLRAKNYINLMVGSKQPTPVWLTPEEAGKVCDTALHMFHLTCISIVLQEHPCSSLPVWTVALTLTCNYSATIHDFHSLLSSVLVGIGVEVTFEVIAAAALLRRHAPDLRVRVVNVTDLMILADEGLHPHSLNRQAFESLFTCDKPVHFNYHGYPIDLKGLLFGRFTRARVTIEGYNEEGTTTSPFDVSSLFPTTQES